MSDLNINYSPSAYIKHSPRIYPESEGKARHFVLFQGSSMWGSSATCKSYIDTLLSNLNGIATDIVPLIYNPWSSPMIVWGDSTLCHKTTVTIDGHTPLGYCIEQAHAIGIKVYAWWCFMFSSEWCETSTFLLSGQPNDSGYKTSDNIILYSVASTRTKMANCLADFYDQNPELDGQFLDYIRTNGNIYQDPADITTLVHLIRDTVDPACEIGFFSLANMQALSGNKQDGATWVQNGYVDFTCAMGYDYNFGRRMEYLEDLLAKPLYIGLSCTPDEVEDSKSGYKTRLIAYYLRGFGDQFTFEWRSDALYPGSTALGMLEDYINGDVTPPTMGNVTRISVNWTTGGSLSYTMDGVTRTLSYATGSSYTTDREFKNYFENLYGEIPYLFFNFVDITIIRVMLGDTWLGYG